MARLKIIEESPAGNLCVNLLFSDNKRKKINVGEYILAHPHPQYNKYLDESEIEKFTLDDGNIVWGEDWDLIFPIEQLYAGAIV